MEKVLNEINKKNEKEVIKIVIRIRNCNDKDKGNG